MKVFQHAVLFTMLFLAPSLCFGEVTNRIVAIINDDIITLRDVERFVTVEKKGPYTSMNEYMRNMALREKLDFFVDGVLIKQQARKLKIEVGDKEVDGAIEQIKKQNLITDGQLKEQLQKEGVEFKDFVDGIRTSIIRNRVLTRAVAQDVAVDDKSLQDYYNRHRSDFVDEEYKLQQIFVSRQKDDGAARAAKALELLKSGKSFGAVAKEYSDDPSKDAEGDIGFAKKDDLMPELREAVRSLSLGGYTGIVQTPYGFHILKLNELRKGDNVPFEEVKDKVKETVYQVESERRYREYMAKLRSSAYIEVKI